MFQITPEIRRQRQSIGRVGGEDIEAIHVTLKRPSKGASFGFAMGSTGLHSFIVWLCLFIVHSFRLLLLLMFFIVIRYFLECILHFFYDFYYYSHSHSHSYSCFALNYLLLFFGFLLVLILFGPDRIRGASGRASHTTQSI